METGLFPQAVKPCSRGQALYITNKALIYSMAGVGLAAPGSSRHSQTIHHTSAARYTKSWATKKLNRIRIT
jgi:hypothetical protein